MHDAFVVVLLRAKRHAKYNNTPPPTYLTVRKDNFDYSRGFARVHEPETLAL